jgi:hypothetical protein
MLVLFCILVVQTNNNKFSLKEKKTKILVETSKKKCKFVKKKAKDINFKNIINKIHKLIV